MYRLDTSSIYCSSHHSKFLVDRLGKAFCFCHSVMMVDSTGNDQNHKMSCQDKLHTAELYCHKSCLIGRASKNSWKLSEKSMGKASILLKLCCKSSSIRKLPESRHSKSH